MTHSDDLKRNLVTRILAALSWSVVAVVVSLLAGCDAHETQHKTDADATNTPTAQSAMLALTISELTGWERFEVQVGNHEEGQHVIITKIPGPPDGHMSVFFHSDGRVEEFEVP